MGVDFRELTKGLATRKTPTLNVRPLTASIRRKDPALASALDQLSDYAENLSLRLGELTFSRLGIWNFTDPTGKRIAWVGSNGNFHGGAFETLYVGTNAMSDPANASFVALPDGSVTITGATFTLNLNGITTTISNGLYEGSFTGILVSDNSTGTAGGLLPGFVVLHPPGGGEYSAILYADPTLNGGRLELRDGSESGGQDGLGRKVLLNGEDGYAHLSGGLADGNGNEVLRIGTVASAVNDLAVFNAATTNRPKLSASPGSADTDVTVELEGKGAGKVNVTGEDDLTVNDIIVPQFFYVPFRILGGVSTHDWHSVVIIPDAAEIVSVTERHRGAGTNPSAVTLMVEKAPSGTQLGSGTDCLSAGISLKAAVDTNQAGSLHGTQANYQFAAGDSVGLVDTGVMTGVDDVSVAIKFKRI